MKEITQEQFDSMLDLHDKWLGDLPGGKRADFSHTNLSKINLARANMEGANLARANLERANMARANLARAYMERANLANAYLARANMAGAYLARANMVGANLADAYMADANLVGANLADAYMADANLARANMEGANLARAYMAEEYGKLITTRPILQINNIGRDNSCLSATFCEKAIVITRGCFYGSLEEFEKRVDEVHGDSIHGKEYKAAIAFIKLHKDLWSEQSVSESKAAKEGK